MKCQSCGSEGYAFLYDSTCGDCLLKQRDEARALAWEYRFDIRQLAGEYQWEKNYANDVQDYPWLPERWEQLEGQLK